MTRFVHSFVSSVGSSWCQLMHPDPMWPVNGEYQCRVCLRKYPVAWEQPESVVTGQRLPAHPETISAATVTHSF